MAKAQIDIFKKTIESQLLGPGSDIFYCDNKHEVIGDFPLKRYYTGILFPQQILSHQEEKDTEIPNDSGDIDTPDAINDSGEIDASDDIDAPDNITDKHVPQIDDSNEEKINLSNHFHPSNMGISFCVDKHVELLEVNFDFATYKQVKQTEAKIYLTIDDYNILIDDKNQFPFKNILDYKKIDDNNGYLTLTEELKGEKKKRTEDYNKFDKWKKNHGKDLYKVSTQFNKLMARLWKRTSIAILENIKLKTNNKPTPFTKFKEAGYTLKVYIKNNRKYIKIQLVNLFPGIDGNKFSNTKETLNKSCLFQAKISVETDKLLSYKPYDTNEKYDEEKQKLDFLYRNVEHFSIGHNCSSLWEPLKKPNKVTTSFIPTYDLKSTETKIKNLDDISLFDLSIWNNDKEQIIKKLTNFISKYSDWIKTQKDNTGNKIGKNIINDLNKTLDRLEEGVKLLADNPQLFKAFQYTNAAMLLQFTLKKEFYKKIQDTEINKICPCNEEQKKSIIYRPFQLAFLLLSLESTINIQSKYRTNNVDLIWFPTGGGKTEAYLAVAALTIIWRRMVNTHYQGVSIIMRYTLRLLTAQQFERATKLITVLEYLRTKFKNDFKDDIINIGLWIGQSSTPNSIEDAKVATKQITNKGISSNKFQIDTCPWCNNKLIKEINGTYKHAFNIRKKKKNLKIKCLNEKCEFYRGCGLPVQVVDDILYKNPPTLLFATVDKMAMLSWKELGHKFFNSLGDDNNLPPDLIIQDELHLLTGPLGSIVGLFEVVIEALCTKKNRSPKIIASTATTRNTKEQVKQLYGNREVNIFPPSGLTYNDSFFFKESEDSNRKYLGFMPTGKTGIDTQIHLLAVLFIARLKIYLKDKTQINPYWTFVSYYNSLRDVGRMYNKTDDEIKILITQKQKRLQLDQYSFNHIGLKNRTKELTSRIESSKIKQNLDQLEHKFEFNEPNKKSFQYVANSVVDLVLATNMLSVGIDIDRLNMILINGMPRNTAEYIQASSRIGRKDKGLVVSFFDSNRARDKSYFEHFLSFHQSLYKQIEPLSITPFTQNTINKMIASLMITYIRHKKNLNKNKDIGKFKIEYIDDLKTLLKKRFPENKNLQFCENKLDELAKNWKNKINQETPYNKYSGKESALLAKPNTKNALEDSKWIVVQSMRDIDSSSFIQIQIKDYTNE